MTLLRSADKPVNRMDRLADMGHFPAFVNAGATANVLITLCVTWWLVGVVLRRLGTSAADGIFRLGGPARPQNTAGALQALQFWSVAIPLLWVALVLIVNLAPVVLLRLRLTPEATYPPLREMNFVTDQHKFSSSVYLAASANMAFWVLLGWVAFTWSHTWQILVGLLAVAAMATFSPVLLRGRS